MPKKAAIKRKSFFLKSLPLVVIFILLLLFIAAILRIGIGEAEWAGLVVSKLNRELRARYDIPAGEKGVCVVIAQEQALNSGVKKGDLLKSINGMAIRNVSSFLQVARYTDIREGVLLDIIRDGEPLYLTLYDLPGAHEKIKRYLGLDPKYANQVAMRISPNTITPHTWLGLELDPERQGMVIDDVRIGSAADKAGFKPGDMITAIDGVELTDTVMFNKLTLNGRTKSATVEILRGKDTLYVFIQDELPRGMAQREAFSLSRPLASGAGRVKFSAPVLTNIVGRAALLPPVEGHWVGMETLELLPQLALFMNIPANIKGVLIDEVTMEAQDAGLIAGDVVVKIGGMDTFTLKQFRAATRIVKNNNVVEVVVYRKGNYLELRVKSLWALGMAQMETAPIIAAGAVAPHRYRGSCTSCHTIGKVLPLAKDNGDLLNINAPPIKKGAKAPHRFRGNCMTCHTIIK